MKEKETHLVIGFNDSVKMEIIFNGICNLSRGIIGFTYQSILPILNAICKDVTGKKIETKVSKDSYSITVTFSKPLFFGQKYSFNLSIFLKSELIKKFGSLNILEWPKKDLTELHFLNNSSTIFFNSTLAQISADRTNKYRILKPDLYTRSLQSKSHNRGNLRIEWGKLPKIRIKFNYNIKNQGNFPIRDFSLNSYLPPATKFQDTEIEKLDNSINHNDKDNNLILNIKIDKIPPRSTIQRIFHVDIVPKGNIIIKTANFGNFDEYYFLTTDKKIGHYLIDSSKYWDFSAGNIQKLVKDLRKKSSNVSDYIKLAFQFVNQNINYKINEKRENASNVLKNLSGDCSEFSDLLVTLLRAGSIPAKMIIGWVIDIKDLSLNPHGWVEFFSIKHGWIQCDPTWGYLIGVSCQHVCRQREGFIKNQPNFECSYRGEKKSLTIKEEVSVESIS